MYKNIVINFTSASLIILSGIMYVGRVPVLETTLKTMICQDPVPVQIQYLNESAEIPKPKILYEGEYAGIPFAVEHFYLLPKGIDLNRANASLLTMIHGIGPVRAERIVLDRELNGFYTSRDNFYQRAGICVKSYKSWVYVGN